MTVSLRQQKKKRRKAAPSPYSKMKDKRTRLMLFLWINVRVSVTRGSVSPSLDCSGYCVFHPTEMCRVNPDSRTTQKKNLKKIRNKKNEEEEEKTIKTVIIVIFSGLFEAHLFRVFNCFSHTFYCVLMSHAKIGHLGLHERAIYKRKFNFQGKIERDFKKKKRKKEKETHLGITK